MTSAPDATDAPDPADAADPADLGYEQAREELVEVVRRLESGSPGLEESLRLWERGEALARRCEEWLAGARARIEAVQAARAPDGAGEAAVDPDGEAPR